MTEQQTPRGRAQRVGRALVGVLLVLGTALTVAGVTELWGGGAGLLAAGLVCVGAGLLLVDMVGDL